MKLDEYLQKTGRTQSAFASLIGVSQGSIHQVVRGLTYFSPEKCVQIEELTGGLVMRWDLRPFDWRKIWPELRKRKDAPKEVTHV